MLDGSELRVVIYGDAKNLPRIGMARLSCIGNISAGNKKIER